MRFCLKEPRTELLCNGCIAPLPPSWFVVGAVGELLVLVLGQPGYGIDWRETNRPSSGLAVCLAGLPTPSGCFQTGSRNATVISGCVTGSRNETVIGSAGCSGGRSAAFGVLLAAAFDVLPAASLGVLQLSAFCWLQLLAFCSCRRSAGCSSWRSAVVGVLLAAAFGVLLAAALDVLQLLAFCSSWRSAGCSS